jgi:hypothetical protein
MAISNGAGMDTTRLSGAPDAVAERETEAVYARRYVIRTGNEDLLEVLGLDGGEATSRHCKAPGCGQPFAPTGTGGKQECCSRTCASKLAAAERRANASERMAKVKGNA